MIEVNSINVKYPIFELSRSYNTIYGFDNQSTLFQIDTKHTAIYYHHLPYAPFSFKRVNYFGRDQYAIVEQKFIQISNLKQNQKQGQLNRTELVKTNNLSSFLGPIDSYMNLMVFTKYHKNHNKVSLNLFKNSQKKVIRLFDQPLLYLKINKFYPQIIFSTTENEIRYINLQKPDQESLLVKKAIIVFDDWNLYCANIDLVSKHNNAYDLQVVDLKSGKQNFTFKGSKIPKKIQTFGNNIFYMTQNSLDIYDKRKIQAIQSVNINKMNDFLLEPNLSKIYISCENDLKIMSY